MDFEAFPNLLINQLLGYLVTLSQNHQVLTLVEVFLLLLVGGWFRDWKVVTSDLTEHVLEVLVVVKCHLHFVLGTN
jgi:hypothetical protein